MACGTGGGGCHGAWQTGAVPANPAGLQQSQSLDLLIKPGMPIIAIASGFT